MPGLSPDITAEAPDPELLKICHDVCHGAKLGEGPEELFGVFMKWFDRKHRLVGDPVFYLLGLHLFPAARSQQQGGTSGEPDQFRDRTHGRRG